MNLPEFKAWFEGFTESLTAAPNAQQWTRIKEKIGKIKDEPPTSRTVFVDYYERPWRRWMDRPCERLLTGYELDAPRSARQSFSHGRSSATARDERQRSEFRGREQAKQLTTTEHFDSFAAFRSLGRAEMKSIRG